MSNPNDQATQELLDTLDALYPLPIARRRKERAIQTAEAVAKWMRAQFAALENEVPKVMSAALAAVQQETEEGLKKWLKHEDNCRSRFPRDYCRRHGGDGGIAGCPTCQNVPVYLPCSCGLSDHLMALSAPKAPRPEAASQSLRGDTPMGRLRGAMAEELADVDINARMEEVRGGWASEVFDPPLWWRRGGEEWEPVYNAAVLMSYVLNAQRHGREFTVLRTQSPPSSVRLDAGIEDGHLAAQAKTDMAPPGGLVDHLQGSDREAK